MGVRYVMFDDSVGIEGVCQRMYPAVPTIPMIMNPDMLEPGDQLSWVYSPDPGPGGGGSSQTRLKLEITPEFIQKCRMAGSRVRRCMMLPSLAEFIPQWQPHKGLDTSKYILELGGPD